jgi:hypothetical protein
MPKPNQLEGIAERGRNNPKLGDRKFRRYPSGKTGYIGKKREYGGRKTPPPTSASIEVEGGLITVKLRNNTGHPVVFSVGGLPTPFGASLDGNMAYESVFPDTGETITVSIDDVEIATTMEEPEDG